MKFLIRVIAIIYFFSTSCTHSILGSRRTTTALTQKAIFKYLSLSNIFLDSLTGKDRIKLDPLLRTREALRMNGTVYFDQPMYSDLLKYPLPKTTYRLVIPDSLTAIYRYTDVDEDYEHQYAIIHQFSPLLPSTEPNIFLMEHYIWANSCDELICVRALNRDFLKFKLENQNVIYLGSVHLRNMIDFIGFGSFYRKKMEEALPDEKIVKFGL